jgi:hypothetical protein
VKEAFKLHKVPADRVVVTGAPRFDEFFEMRPATTKEQFCGLVDLDPSAPIVTYLCSSKFVAATEKEFVERWITELRRSTNPVLAGCSVLVRPHPAGTKGWHTDPRHVVRWPGEYSDKASTSRPFADSRSIVMNSPMQNADQVLYDTVFHSAAVVGLNTSAEIEAAIVGRPVFTIIDPEAGGQSGTLHFHYLLQQNGGHVRLAESFDEHRRQLEDALSGPAVRAAIDAFLQTFVRPHGRTTPVSPLVTDAIESLVSSRARAVTQY